MTASASGGGQTESSEGSRDHRLPIDLQSSPNPIIESVLISQGIQAPANRTTGGVGGILGLSALASYGFLPGSDDNLSLDRQLSLMSIQSEKGLTSTYKPAKNTSKPKNAVRASNSSFVIKTQFHPDLKDILAQMEKSWSPSRSDDPMAFMQRGRTLLWLQDTTSKKEPLGRYLFASPPSAHDVNQLTRSPTTLDIIIGFPTGDILWLDAIGARYSRFNKGGILTDSGITQIRWLPSASNDGLFMTAHADGTMIVWDREREDGEVNKAWAPRRWTLMMTSSQKEEARRREAEALKTTATLASNSVAGGDGDMEVLSTEPQPQPGANSYRPVLGQRQYSGRSLTANGPGALPGSRSASPSKGGRNRAGTASVPPLVPRSAVEWDPQRDIVVSRPGSQVEVDQAESGPAASIMTPTSDEPGPATLSTSGLPSRGRRREQSLSLGEAAENTSVNGTTGAGVAWTKNPISHWRVSTRRIHTFAISPDLGCVAVVADDGLLKIIDLTTERLIATHASYFGPFLSVAWSADGRFLLTTGCDDLVSIYHPRDLGGGQGGHSYESRFVARCVGHTSWVKNVAFDPYRWKEGDRTYRFGSVGEDGKVLLWDFSSASLSRPKQSARRSGDRSSPSSAGFHAAPAASPAPGLASSTVGEDAQRDQYAHDAVFHPAPSRQAIPQLNPIATYQASHLASLLAIRFRPSGLLLHHSNGILQTFQRPAARVLQLGDDDEDDDTEQSSSAITNRRGADAAAVEKRKKGILGGTFSRGMRWVGGSSTQQQQTQAQQETGAAGTKLSTLSAGQFIVG